MTSHIEYSGLPVVRGNFDLNLIRTVRIVRYDSGDYLQLDEKMRIEDGKFLTFYELTYGEMVHEVWLDRHNSTAREYFVDEALAIRAFNIRSDSMDQGRTPSGLSPHATLISLLASL